LQICEFPHMSPRDSFYACLSSVSLMCSPYVNPVFRSTISFIFGLVNTASVVLATACPALALAISAV
jgi:hypothetical protein